MRKKLLVVTWLNLLLIKASGVQLDLQGPVFVAEPPRRLDFSNTSGGKLECRVRGVPDPVTEWTLGDGSPAVEIDDVRVIAANGSLLFPPFPAEKFRHDVHAAVYRCVARNQVGTILSRDVLVKAVVSQKYEIQVYDDHVTAGNTAVLRCRVPNYLAEYVLITSWMQDDVVHIYPTTDTGGKYIVLKTGELYVFDVGPADGYKAYSCRTVNKLTGKAQSSEDSARIVVTEVQETFQPKLAVDKHSTVYVTSGEDVLLPCVARGHPPPEYRWFREENKVLRDVIYGDRYSESGPGLLHVSKAKADDAGKYLCSVNNSAGRESVHVSLVVTAPIAVHVQPQSQVVDVGKEAVFGCIASGHPRGSPVWYHDGRRVAIDSRHGYRSQPDRLVVGPVQKGDEGMYQCFVSSEWDSAQSAGELRLGDASPELLSWFTERTLHPGPSLSLRCSAAGNPPPHFTWALDGFPVPDSNRFMMGQYITVDDDVITHLNISSVHEEDGGEYSCTARNSVSQVTYGARINVYGRPFIRSMPRVNAVAGTELVIKCPVAGYPIESVAWERAGAALPVNRRQRVFANGTLVVESVQRQADAGTYTCQARNGLKESDRRDVEVHVMVPPKILPIQGIVLREGMRAAITCQVIDGDLPFRFRWQKDGGSLPEGQESAVRRVDEYASLLVIDGISSRHAGRYTCSAENDAGEESFTVPVTVNVPPKWLIEPMDASVAAGNDVVLDCQATGHPEPSIVWKKSTGEFPGEYKDFVYEANVDFFPNGSLRFAKVTKESQGHYLCEAKNGVGSGMSKLIFLKVNVPAHFPHRFQQVEVVHGDEARLQCPALGDAPIDVTWRVNGQRVRGDEYPRYLLREHPLDEGLLSELAIAHTYRHDTGTFSCHASNAFGEDETKIQLIIQEAPEVPGNVRVSDTQSRSIRVTWTQPYAGNSPITGYTVEYRLEGTDWDGRSGGRATTPGTSTQATLKGLRPATSYQVRVAAENRLGRSDPSDLVQGTTLEEAPAGPPLDVRVDARTSTEIRVTWKPPERSTWNGRLLGYYVGYREETNSTPGRGYDFKTIEAGAQYGGDVVVGKLNKFTGYSVVVQAFNSKGSSPASKPVFVRTMEDVPSSAPLGVTCRTMSSQSIEVRWEPPEPGKRHGLLLGYKVLYGQADASAGEGQEAETKITTMTKTILSGLWKYANYSLSVLAFTSAGEGVKSRPIFCRTEEDVPSPPKDIKAAASSPSRILVSWLPPRHRNGLLTSYTVYMSLLEDGREEGTHKRILGPEIEFHEASRRQAQATYQFWVTASTRVGEGESSRVVTLPPSTKVPARILSFGRAIVTPWKRTVNLTCRRVGLPAPHPVWKFMERLVENGSGRGQVQRDGSLVLRDVQKSDQGNYSCSVENSHGRDEITYSLAVEIPPDKPRLSVISSTSDSLQLEWTVDESNGVLGYVINYKRDHGDWEEIQLGAGVNSYSLQNLWCAARYQLYVTAYNKIGMGLPCDIVNGYTLGTVPTKPSINEIVAANQTTASVRLDPWHDGGCPIHHFVVEYRPTGASTWSLASSTVGPGLGSYIVSGLRPGTGYVLRVTAHNGAGSSAATYNITTLAQTGGSPVPGNESGNLAEVPFRSNVKMVVIPVAVVALLCLVIAAAVVYYHRRRSGQESMTTSPATFPTLRSPGAESKPGKPDDEDEEEDYVSDICPYAAFKISKPPYSESAYSGNIYSGAYNSVGGSYPFRDLNADVYKVKKCGEVDHCKPRRSHGKLRDPNPESQESDNLGSTDSEVRKILSMHAPISAGSDSDAERPVHRHRSRPGKPIAKRFDGTRAVPGLENGSEEEEEDGDGDTSTSSAEVPVPRKPVRRHVRSSSGYSSHTEETSFRYAATPGSGRNSTLAPLTDSDCSSHPKAVNLLQAEDRHRVRRRSPRKEAKFHGETSFQIDV